ncbi:MAG: hypothetical protein AAGF31_04890 [Planctomycetota bacterium]
MTAERPAAAEESPAKSSQAADSPAPSLSYVGVVVVAVLLAGWLLFLGYLAISE